MPEGPGTHPDYPRARGAQQVIPVDLDRDGDPDLVSVSTLRDTLAWYENDGAAAPSFNEHVITENPHAGFVTSAIAEPRSVAASDLDGDGDGDPDLVTASSLDDQIAWFEHDGTARSRTLAPRRWTAAHSSW